MLTVSVSIKSALPALPGLLTAAASLGVRRIAERLRDEVKDGERSFYNVYPEGDYERTYRLRESWEAVQLGTLEWEVGNDPAIADYAPQVELGGPFTPPRPSLGPSADAIREDVRDIMEEAVAPSLTRALAGLIGGQR